jgi:hypothetical protein
MTGKDFGSSRAPASPLFIDDRAHIQSLLSFIVSPGMVEDIQILSGE